MLASFLESYLGAYLLRFSMSRPRNAGISAIPLLQVSNAVISKDVAQVPEFLDNIGRCGHKARFWLDKN